MPRLSLWNPKKTNDFKFFDNNIREQYLVGGTAIMVHKYLGPIDQGNDDTEIRQSNDKSQPNYKAEKDEILETDIQDLFFLENRDRKYDPHVYELRGHYQIQDNDFNLTQISFIISTDTIFITFHYNHMIEQLGRKILSGDVFELPHLRDSDLLDKTLPAINKYYVVEDAQRAAEGFGPSWYHHIWRCKCSPINNQQEFYDILHRHQENFYGEETDNLLADILSSNNKELDINQRVDAEANAQVPRRFFAHQHLYILPVKDVIAGETVTRNHIKYPVIYMEGDGVPPNGAIPIGSGNQFPLNADEGDFYLRTDYVPNVLFRKESNIWKRQEIAVS